MSEEDKRLNQKLRELVSLIEQERSKVIDKPITINRFFVRSDGFQKTMTNELDQVTKGTVADLRRTYYYRIPLPPKVSLGIKDDEIAPSYLQDSYVNFILRKFDYEDKKNKIVINMFYEEE